MSLAPAAVFLEFYFALNELSVLSRPIINTAAFRTRDFYELILRHTVAALYQISNSPQLSLLCVEVLEVGQEDVADLVPRTEGSVGHCFHQCIDNEPPGENYDESDEHIAENTLRICVLF